MSNQVFSNQLDTPFLEELDFLTVVSESESGKEQRYQKWTKGRRHFTIKLNARQLTETTSIWRFYVARKGAFDTFLFQNPNESPVTAETVGSGDGSTSIFYLGSQVDFATGDLTVISGSDTLTRSVKGTGDYLAFSTYTINNSTGQITTNVALPSGDVLRANYSFYYVVRFRDDKLQREAFATQLWNYGVDLIEVI